MTALTEEMKAVFAKNKIFPVATASKRGIPNVVPIANVQLANESTIWIGDNYMHKTLENARENPHAAIHFWDPDTKKCFQVKGDVKVLTSGDDYEKMKKMIKAKKETYPAKSLLVLSIREVFECTPGETAGKKVL
jgi:predicted pyridoxine 5'-phosphate oxidase superfamily flavin-nucleotide-binding protein